MPAPYDEKKSALSGLVFAEMLKPLRRRLAFSHPLPKGEGIHLSFSFREKVPHRGGSGALLIGAQT